MALLVASATAGAPEGAATWVVDRSHVIISAGRKGISAGGKSKNAAAF